MRRLLLASALALLAAPAAASPFDELLAAGGGKACFRQTYDEAYRGDRPGQVTSEVLLSFSAEEVHGREGVVMRLMLKRPDGAWYVWGGCGWAEQDVNRGAGGRLLQPEYPLEHGISCHASAGGDEEGGDFPIELIDADTLAVYPGEGLAARDALGPGIVSTYATFERPDLMLPVKRTDPEACRELVEGLGTPIGYPPE